MHIATEAQSSAGKTGFNRDDDSNTLTVSASPPLIINKNSVFSVFSVFSVTLWLTEQLFQKFIYSPSIC